MKYFKCPIWPSIPSILYKAEVHSPTLVKMLLYAILSIPGSYQNHKPCNVIYPHSFNMAQGNILNVIHLSAQIQQSH